MTKEKVLTQRQMKRLEWWKKNNENEELSSAELRKEKRPSKEIPRKTHKLKQADSNDDAVSLALKRRRIDNDELNGGKDVDQLHSSSKENKKRSRNAVIDNSKVKSDVGGLLELPLPPSAKGKPKKIKTGKVSDSGEPLPPRDGKALPDGSKKLKLSKNIKAYVLFVGNLSYDTTKEDIEGHFLRTGGVKDVRLLTEKNTGKSKGCAYVEFLDSKSHKFGLRLHESTLGGRKINVEFTSRGRKTPKRTERLKEKNRRMARLKRVFEPSSKGAISH